MKLKLLIPMLDGNKRSNPGDIIEVPDHKVKKWKKLGWAEDIVKKEAKPKKETKELKIDSKETKDATDKD
jgi:hypothetical protein